MTYLSTEEVSQAIQKLLKDNECRLICNSSDPSVTVEHIYGNEFEIGDIHFKFE